MTSASWNDFTFSKCFWVLWHRVLLMSSDSWNDFGYVLKMTSVSRSVFRFSKCLRVFEMTLGFRNDFGFSKRLWVFEMTSGFQNNFVFSKCLRVFLNDLGFSKCLRVFETSSGFQNDFRFSKWLRVFEMVSGFPSDFCSWNDCGVSKWFRGLKKIWSFYSWKRLVSLKSFQVFYAHSFPVIEFILCSILDMDAIDIILRCKKKLLRKSPMFCCKQT